MSTPVSVPDLGSATISVSSWLVDLGEDVLEGDRIVELLVPGVTFDVTAPVAGRLASVVRNVDDVVRVGDVLGWIETDADDGTTV